MQFFLLKRKDKLSHWLVYFSEDEESKVEKYKALLLGENDDGDKQKDKKKKPHSKGSRAEEDGGADGNMEMTFADKSVEEAEAKQREFEGMTPWEQYLHKRKLKKEAKRLKRSQQVWPLTQLFSVSIWA